MAFTSCQGKNNNSNNHNPTSESEVPLIGDKIIVTDAIGGTIGMFDYIPLNQVYGFCNGQRFGIKATVTKPNGEIVETNKKLYVDQEGIYHIKLESNIGGTLVQKSIEVNANTYSTKALFEYTNSSFIEDDATISDFITEYSADTGVKLKLSATNSIIKYKNVVDLQEINGNLIEFSPNPHSPVLNIEGVKITLTDAYDSNRHISVTFRMNDAAHYPNLWQHGSMNTFAQVQFNGYTVANWELFPAVKTYTVLWDQAMWTNYSDDPTVVGSYTPVSFMYDYENMLLKACGRIGNWNDPSKYHVLYDLDDPDDNLRDFEGWTTGEVFVSIESDGTSGDLVVTKIGNDFLTSNDSSLFQKSTGELLTKGYDFDNLPHGAVNYYYPFADTSSSNTGIISKLFKVNNDESLEEVYGVDFHNFYPQETGNYLIRYESKNNFSHPLVKEGRFVVDATPAAINDVSTLNLETKIFDTNTIPQFTYTGGNGTLKKRIELVIGNDVSIHEEGDYYIIEKKEDVNKIRVVVTDSINNQRTFEYPITVDYNVIKFDLIDSFDTVSIIEGNDFIVPNYRAIDYSKTDISQTNIPILIKQGKNQAYQPGDRITINSNTSLSYISGTTTLKVLNINCVPYDISSATIGDQFPSRLGVEDVSVSMSGLNFTSNGEPKMEFTQPYPLGTTNLNISVTVFPRMMNYDSVSIDLIALDGNYIHLELQELKNGRPYLYINGVKSSFFVEVISETYMYDDVPSLKSQPYFTYTLVVDSAKKGILNSSGIKGDEIKTWANGKEFTKFDKACTLIKYSIDNPGVGDLFSLYRISNQLLTSVGLDYGDLAAPVIAFEGSMLSKSFEIDDYFLVPKAYAYDFFSDGYNVQMSIIDSDGEYIINKAPSNQYPLVFSKYGSYSIVYNFKDARDNGSTSRYILVARDSTPPTITLDKEYSESYKGSVKIISATVKDNYDTEPTLSISIADTNGKRTFVSANEKVSLEKGYYEIIYYASDKEGNSSRLVRKIEIK